MGMSNGGQKRVDRDEGSRKDGSSLNWSYHCRGAIVKLNLLTFQLEQPCFSASISQIKHIKLSFPYI